MKIKKEYLLGIIAIIIVIIIGAVLILSNNKKIPVLDEDNYEIEDEEHYEIKNDEYDACTLEYMPVCGIDGITYANKCMAKDIEILYEGECEGFNFEEDEEHRACTLEYMPVCGIDGITYGNACSAGNTEIAYEGECSFEDDIRVLACENHGGRIETRKTNNYEYYVCIFEDNSECEAFKLANGACFPGDYIFEIKNCTREFDPVCGINGITYANPCIAGNIPIEYQGECK